MLTFNFVVVVLNVLGSLHVLPHQLHGDHPQRLHLPHTHSGSVEASFETQLVSKIHIKTNIFEGEKIMSVPRYIMINDPLLAIDLTVSRCKKLLLLGYSESPIFFISIVLFCHSFITLLSTLAKLCTAGIFFDSLYQLPTKSSQYELSVLPVVLTIPNAVSSLETIYVYTRNNK